MKRLLVPILHMTLLCVPLTVCTGCGDVLGAIANGFDELGQVFDGIGEDLGSDEDDDFEDDLDEFFDDLFD